MLRSGALTLLLTLSLVSLAHSEGYQFTSLSVSSGEDTLSSGLTGIIRFASDDRVVELAVQREQAWVCYGPTFTLWDRIDTELTISAGHFQGSPWGGPRLVASMPLSGTLTLSTMQWIGLQAWPPKDWDDDGIDQKHPMIGYLGSLSLSIGRLGLTYSWQNFMSDPWNELPAVSYTHPLRNDFVIKTSATWNNNSDKWMFYVGGEWSP